MPRVCCNGLQSHVRVDRSDACLACFPRAGLAVSLGYQALYTVPRWRRLVGSHLAAQGTTGAQALGLLAGFGAFYNVHNIAQVLGAAIAPALRRPSLIACTCSSAGAVCTRAFGEEPWYSSYGCSTFAGPCAMGLCWHGSSREHE